jgi:guanylate kinase
LRDRGTEDDGTLKVRVEKAVHELSFADRFDATIVNDDLEAACAEAVSLVRLFLF